MARASFCSLTDELRSDWILRLCSGQAREGARPHTSPNTLLAVAILSLGSIPPTAAAEADDFCSPTYPSDASFCISDELNSADLAASPLKCRSKLSSCAAIVSSVAFEV